MLLTNIGSEEPPTKGGMLGRGSIEGYAMRTRKNLEFIVGVHMAQIGDVHVVTHLVNSLVGLVVFPWERTLPESYRHLLLVDLEEKGWPAWDHGTSARPPKTLWQLIMHLRHAVAHGRVEFSSNSRNLDEVMLSFWNLPPGDAPRWDDRIRGDDLLEFCRRLSQLLENMTA